MTLAAPKMLEGEYLSPYEIKRTRSVHCTFTGGNLLSRRKVAIAKLRNFRGRRCQSQVANERTNDRPNERQEQESCTERRVLSKFSSPTTSSIYLSGAKEVRQRERERENGKALWSCWILTAESDGLVTPPTLFPFQKKSFSLSLSLSLCGRV